MTAAVFAAGQKTNTTVTSHRPNQRDVSATQASGTALIYQSHARRGPEREMRCAIPASTTRGVTVSEQSAAQKIAEEYVLTHGCLHGSEQHRIAEAVAEMIFAKIRERRDELDTQGPGVIAFEDACRFWHAFDSGAYFGPAKKGPTFERNPKTELVTIQFPGGHPLRINDVIYRAIQDGPKLEDIS